ncbi:hypothetical protein ACHAWF_004760 [Thalassiosira exigua]
MQHLIVGTGLVSIACAHNASGFGGTLSSLPSLAHSNRRRCPDAPSARTSVVCPLLSARRSSDERSARPSDPPRRSKKKNKYADFSKADKLSMDPLDTMISESRDKLQELHGEGSKSSRRRRKSPLSEMTSLEAVDQLLTPMGETLGEEEGGAAEVEKRERNKRVFPDTKAIDPYDPTTYGYIELGEFILCVGNPRSYFIVNSISHPLSNNMQQLQGTIIGAHGVHGMMKLASVTDFSQHRLCHPGIRHIRPPNRRSPREVRLVEGRPLRPDAASAADANPMFLIKLENVEDREDALKMRGCMLYALEDEKVDNLLEEDEYIVSDLIGLNVFLNDSGDQSSGKGFEDLFVGNIRGVIMGSEMCSVPGLGQDMLEVALPSPHGGQGEDLVLIPFVPEIVSQVDLESRMVSINPPEGLLDLSYRREEKVRIKALLPPSPN